MKYHLIFLSSDLIQTSTWLIFPDLSTRFRVSFSRSDVHGLCVTLIASLVVDWYLTSAFRRPCFNGCSLFSYCPVLSFTPFLIASVPVLLVHAFYSAFSAFACVTAVSGRFTISFLIVCAYCFILWIIGFHALLILLRRSLFDIFQFQLLF